MKLISASLAMALLWTPLTLGDEPTKLGPVDFKGDIFNSKNISGIAVVGDFLVIGADEGGKIQVLKNKGDHYKLVSDIVLDEAGKEIDIEGIACDGNLIYVMGSHSWKREKVEATNSVVTNRELIATSGPEPSRDRLFRFSLDAQGKASKIEVTSLRSVIDMNEVLKTFRAIPSKENGIDIEGIASADGHLFAGFRGPVLRENHTPILKFAFANPIVTTELLFVNLGGRGVRDLTRVRGGFLVLAGPVGDGPGSYQLYFWDGRDCLPGHRTVGTVGRIELLCKIPTPDDAKAEGIALLKEADSAYEVLIVYDGLKDGGVTRFRISKP
jgi:hypothetical protein